MYYGVVYEHFLLVIDTILVWTVGIGMMGHVFECFEIIDLLKPVCLMRSVPCSKPLCRGGMLKEASPSIESND